MDRNTLGRSTLTVSRVGLGCNNFGRRIDREASLEVLAAAVDAGITFFDTADVYGLGASERIVGEALAGRSDDLVVATKFGMDMEGANGDAPGGSREYVRRAIDASLGRLGRDHVDLYYYHRPDGVTPLDETLGAMHELVVEGKVRWLGLSNADPGISSRQPPSRRPATARSSRCRTSSACSIATTRRTCCRSRASSGWATSRTSRSRAAS